MPWSTPTLREVRSLVRDMIKGALPGADALVPNSVLRVLSDNQGALCSLTLQYIDWLSLQLLPDTAETEWLDRHADIWLINADGTTGRKMATLAEGSVTAVGAGGIVIPQGARLSFLGGSGAGTIEYETLQEVVTSVSGAPTAIDVRALDPGIIGNQAPGTQIRFVAPPVGVASAATVVTLDGGVDTENDDDLRVRVLERIRQPPMGGCAYDYIAWAKRVPGVTRAWCGPIEMGMGTVTVRFMMDALRAENDGFPSPSDCQDVSAYIDTVRPVAVKDYFVVAPIPQRVDVYIQRLVPDTVTVRAGIEENLQNMLFHLANPGQTIFAAWKYDAIMDTPGVESFDLRITANDVMPSPGHMPTLGDIVYDVPL